MCLEFFFFFLTLMYLFSFFGWLITALRSSFQNLTLKHRFKMGMVGRTSYPTMWETEAGRAVWVWSQPSLHMEFQASQSCTMKTLSEKTNQTEMTKTKTNKQKLHRLSHYDSEPNGYQDCGTFSAHSYRQVCGSTSSWLPVAMIKYPRLFTFEQKRFMQPSLGWLHHSDLWWVETSCRGAYDAVKLLASWLKRWGLTRGSSSNMSFKGRIQQPNFFLQGPRSHHLLIKP